MHTTRNQISRSNIRITISILTLAVSFLLISMLAGKLQYNFTTIIVNFALGLLITPVMASVIEWAGHKYLCHRKFEFLRRIYTIHSAHHHLYFPPWRYVTGGKVKRIPILNKNIHVPQISKLQNVMTHLGQIGFYTFLGIIFISLPAWLLSQNVFFLLGTLSGVIIISNLFIYIHDAVHRPGNHKMLENQKWFLFIDEHHYIHHVDTESNFNFLLPIADWLFATYRSNLTKSETEKYGSIDIAKTRIIGFGESVSKR